jgi:hypothetical protein
MCARKNERFSTPGSGVCSKPKQDLAPWAAASGLSGQEYEEPAKVLS